METAGDLGHVWEDAPRQAGVAPRAVAAIIDAIVSFVFIATPLTFALGDQFTATDGSGTWWSMTNDVFLLWVALTLVYYTLFEALVGATVGKLVLNLRVRQSDGSPIDFESAVLRNLLRLVDCFPYFIPYLTGAISIWAGNARHDRPRLGDRVADTIVIWR